MITFVSKWQSQSLVISGWYLLYFCEIAAKKWLEPRIAKFDLCVLMTISISLSAHVSQNIKVKTRQELYKMLVFDDVWLV